MALKYYFGFNDIKNIVHLVEIYNEDYTDETIEVSGRVSLSKAETDDTLEAIRGGGLTIDLEANPLLTFSDIYTADERIYSVKYFRDEQLIFYGWISPSDIYESYVENVWNISIDCIDGLGYLKNLSYVENATGLPFTGKQSGLEIITNCLKRTNLDQKINTSINIHYDGDLYEQNVLAFVYFLTDRFIKDDESTYMDCEEVLRSVLEIFGACITQYYGEWYIYKPNEMFDNSEVEFYSHDSNGGFIELKTIDFQKEIGSQQSGFYPHYVNANQQLSTEKPIGAFSVNYKYGLVKKLLYNTNLEYTGSSGSEIIDEWTINNRPYIDFASGSFGYNIELEVINSNNENDVELIMTSDSFYFSEGNILDFTTKTSKSPNLPAVDTAIYYMKVVLTDGVDTYYLLNNGEWSVTSNYLTKNFTFDGGEPFEKKVTSTETPITGDVHIEVYTPLCTESFFTVKIQFYSFDISPVISKEGEVYSFQVKNNPSTNIKETKEVYNGDEPTDAFVGTMYKIDEVTPTELWYRDDNPSRLIPLLRIMGEERMKMYNKPLRVFSGDVFGYIDYLSVISLDGFDGVEFMCISYDYDAYNNITTLKLKQILNNDIGDSDFSGLKYALTYDYGKVVSPTITG